MPADSLLDAEGLSLVARLELVARHAVEGFLSGVHPSPYFGSSVEYADHRPYSIGDDLRTIDWKLLAKTDKYYVKLFEEQTNTRGTILLDTSRSMTFKGEQVAQSKFDYGIRLAAAVAYLMVRQHDAVGLATFDREVRAYLPPRATARHFRHMLETMSESKPGTDTDIGGVLHDLAGKIPKRGIIIFISDMLDDLTGIIDGLSHFKHHGSEVIVFHLIDPTERQFPYEKLTRFRDMEGSGSVIANPRSIRAAYLERIHAFLTSTRRACLERDIGYELADTQQSYGAMLASYLARRSKAT